MSRWIMRILVLAALLTALLLLAPLLRRAYDATLLLADLAQVELPLPDRRPAVRQLDVGYVDRRQDHEAYLFVPRTPARGGLVLIPGAATDGRDDPRLALFASALARSGFAVLVPEIRSLRELRLLPDNARDVAAAVSFLRHDEHVPAGQHIGVGAFSVAAGPAVLAALDPVSGPQIDFVLLVGGYYDLQRTLAYLTTGYFETNHQRMHREPNAYGKWVYALSNASRLGDPAERAALTLLARRKLDDPAAPVDDLLPQLGRDGRSIYRFIDNLDPERVPALIRQLPAAVQSDIRGLNLANYDLSALQARFILVHGMDDNIIPYSESVALYQALPAAHTELHLLHGLHHVDTDVHGRDAWRMWQVLWSVLAQLDADSG